MALAVTYEEGRKFLTPRSRLHKHFLHSFNDEWKARAGTIPTSWMKRLRLRGSRLLSRESGFTVRSPDPDFLSSSHTASKL